MWSLRYNLVYGRDIQQLVSLVEYQKPPPRMLRLKFINTVLFCTVIDNDISTTSFKTKTSRRISGKDGLRTWQNCYGIRIRGSCYAATEKSIEMEIQILLCLKTTHVLWKRDSMELVKTYIWSLKAVVPKPYVFSTIELWHIWLACTHEYNNEEIDIRRVVLCTYCTEEAIEIQKAKKSLWINDNRHILVTVVCTKCHVAKCDMNFLLIFPK